MDSIVTIESKDGKIETELITPVSSVTSGPDIVSSHLSSPFESPEIIHKDDIESASNEMGKNLEVQSLSSSKIDSSDSIVSITNVEELTPKVLNKGEMSFDSFSEDAPPIDPHALQDLETHAKRIAEQVNHTMDLLKSSSFKVSGLTYDSVSYLVNTVDNVCESVDCDIKALYALIAKSEEISKDLKSALSLQEEVNDIKRILDQFETVLAREVKKT